MNPYRPCRATPASFMFAVAAFASAAHAQGPSLTTVPDDPVFADSLGLAISPSGRYVVGSVESDIGSSNYHDDLFRWDRQLGIRFSAVRTFSHFGARVLDDGRIFASTPDIGGFQVDELARVFRWTPETNSFLYVPRTAHATTDDVLQCVSSDGLIGFGFTQAPGGVREPAIFDFTLGTPLRIDLSAGEGSEFRSAAGVTQPANGARFAFGSIVTGTQPGGASWIVAGAQPTPIDLEVGQISPGGNILLGKLGDDWLVRGDGSDRVLSRIFNNTLISGPRMSIDGRTVVGALVIPPSLVPLSQAFVWRVGQAPVAIFDLLAAAGVTIPSNFQYGVSDISADGSTITGTYFAFDDINANGHAYAAVLPALNDTCQTARPISYGTIIDSTNGATRAGVASIPCAAEGAAPDVWFSFVPVATEAVTIDTCGSTYDTTLAVYASSCASLGSPLACNDDAVPSCTGNAVNSRLSVSVFAGQTYFIRVSGWNGNYGSIQLSITAPARPVNDACAQAVSVPPGSGAFWNNTGAITDARPNCPSAGTPFSDLWFRTVTTETGRMTYSTCGSSINTVMAVYPAGACGDTNLTALACGQSSTPCSGSPGTRITLPCTIGDAQLIRVGGLFGATGPGQITARFACDQNDLNDYAARVSASQPRAYWRFNDSGSLTAADAVRADPFSCGNFPGQYLNTPARRRSPQGKALTLNGSGGAVQAEAIFGSRVSDINACPSATLEAWVKTTDPYAGVVLTSRTNPSEHSITMVIGYNPIGIPGTEGRVMFVSDAPGVFFGAISNQRVDDGRWHHIVGRRILSGFSRYSYALTIDGVDTTLSNLPGVGAAHAGTPGGFWTIGNGPAWAPADAAFNGLIDEVAIYCASLAPATIADHTANFDINPCLADFNADGGLDPDDLGDFINCYFALPPCPLADFNQDGSTDPDDLGDFINEYFAGCS